MTWLKVQRGELTDRLRRFFGVVGSYNASVDELVSPVVLAQDISQTPYRTDGIQWTSSVNFIAPPAGQINVWRCRNSTEKPFTIERIICMNYDAANAVRFYMGTTAASTLPGAFSGITGELTPPAGFGQRATSLIVGVSNTAIFPVGTPFAQLRMPANSINDLAMPFTIQPGAELVIENQAAAQVLAFQITGKIFNG